MGHYARIWTLTIGTLFCYTVRKMHKLSRPLLLTVLTLILVPALGTAALLSDVRGETQGQFFSVLILAQETYRTRASALSTGRINREVVERTKQRLAELAGEKRAIRFEIVAEREKFQALTNSGDALLSEGHRLAVQRQLQLERMRTFVREVYVRQLLASNGPLEVGPLFRRLLDLPVDDVEETVTRRALTRAQEGILLSLLVTEDATRLAQERMQGEVGEEAARMQALLDRREVLLAEYRKTDKENERAQHAIVASEAQLKEAQRIMAQVHDDVLKLQAELARIDARLREKAERTLIEMGLRDPRAETGSERSTVRFAWPVTGTITATFHDQRYLARFGVPHNAIDIATHQGTPVTVAADGIVFLVRDGGDSGYTYVLVGHREGYATLYGHLSFVSVQVGQELMQGETIGLSGGQPGTPGSGPLTTGQHLHFELIKRGENIDPLTILSRR